MSWSSNRRFMYAGLVIGSGVLIVGFFLFSIYNKPATCFDGRQNGGEVGVDCGGSCRHICTQEVASLVIKWSRSFRVTSGNYSAVAYVENPNSTAGVQSISYRFDLLDSGNVPIVSREGKAFITPGGISPIFESDIDTGERVPTRTFFEFTEEPQWLKASDTRDRLAIQGRGLVQADSRPRINATLRNSSAVDEFSDIDITAIVFDTDGNAIGASRTFVPHLEPRNQTELVFTWPFPFEKNIEQCLRPIDAVLLFDVSGSMNNAGGDPPEPISSAKESAQMFVDRLAPGDRIGLVSFATEATLEHPLTFTHSDVVDALSALAVSPQEENGSTNIGDALGHSFEELFRVNGERGAGTSFKRTVLLLTDGRANAPTEPGGEPFALSKAREVKATGATVYTIGLGDDVNESFLRDVATLPEYYYQAATVSNLDQIYRSISEDLCEQGPAVLDIIPRTPDAFKEQREE